MQRLGTLVALIFPLSLAAMSPASVSPKVTTRVTHRWCRSLPASGGAAEYRIEVASGGTSCATARTVIARFLRHGRVTAGWDCRNGGKPLRWSAACGSPYRSPDRTWHDTDYARVIKAFYRLDP